MSRESERSRSREPRLAIVGASVRSAVHSALRAGFSPLAADLFADTDLKRVGPATRIANYPGGFADWLVQTECDAWLYTGALENYPELVDSMARLRPLMGSSGAVLGEVRSPLRLAEVLHSAGLSFPETGVLVQSPGVAPPGYAPPGPECGNLDSKSTLIKTGRGSSGSGVSRWNDAAPAAEDSLYVQQRIDGVALSAVFIGNGIESALMGVTKQLVGVPWTRSGRFQYCGSISPHLLPSSNVQQQVEQIGKVLTATFGLLGLFGIDMILGDNQLWTIEVNPRYTAAVELIERATGIQAIPWHLAACRHGNLPDTSIEFAWQRSTHRSSTDKPSTIHGKVILFAKQTATITEAFFHWTYELAHQTSWPDAADIPAPGTVVAARHPIVTLFASGNSAAEVEAHLHHRVTEAEAMLYSPRFF